MPRVLNGLDGVFVIKLREREGAEVLVHHSVFLLDVDGRLALAVAVAVRQEVPVRRTVL